MKTKIKLIFSSAVAGFFILTAASSSILKATIATYDIELKAVESPADAKEQFGETKIVSKSEEGITKYCYEDDFIEIIWYVDQRQFNFTLTNKTNYTFKINWDDICYVDIFRNTHRVMHSGVKYIDRNNSQPSSTLPRGAKLVDCLVPTDYVSTNDSGLDWKFETLLPYIYKDKETALESASIIVGKPMTILFPIMIENVQNDYVFIFNVNDLQIQNHKRK